MTSPALAPVPLTPALYRVKIPTFEMVQWDGSDQRKADLDTWIGNGWWSADDLAGGADPAARTGRLWDPVGRVVLDVAVGDWVAKDAAGVFFVVAADELVAGYELASAPAPAPGTTTEPDPGTGTTAAPSTGGTS